MKAAVMVPPVKTYPIRTSYREGRGGNTPWGKTQIKTERAAGIAFHMTAGHGGYHLSPKRNAQVPDYMRTKDGWYEEDCEWCFVVMSFLDVFDEKTREAAMKTFIGWYPDEAEKFYPGLKVTGAMSHRRAEQEFYAANKDKLVVISAHTSKYHPGMVEVMATPGGNRNPARNELFDQGRWFLIPAEEYRAGNSGLGFVINPAAHAEIRIKSVRLSSDKVLR